MRIRREPAIQVKTAAQLAAMDAAGQVTASALKAAAAAVAPGVSTAELDAIAAAEIRAAGATPSFLGYHGFPATICACVNEAVVDGWHADAALTVPVGTVRAELGRLVGACERALWHGLAAARPGARIGDISHAVQRYARSAGDYGIVQEYGGHGI